MTNCCVPDCTNRTSSKSVSQQEQEKTEKITFHKIPKDPEKRAKWLEAIGRPDLTQSLLHICSDHFSDDCLDRTSLSTVRLREHAIPTIEKHIRNKNVTSKPKDERIYLTCCAIENCFKNSKDTPNEIFHNIENSFDLDKYNIDDLKKKIKNCKTDLKAVKFILKLCNEHHNQEKKKSSSDDELFIVEKSEPEINEQPDEELPEDVTTNSIQIIEGANITNRELEGDIIIVNLQEIIENKLIRNKENTLNEEELNRITNNFDNICRVCLSNENLYFIETICFGDTKIHDLLSNLIDLSIPEEKITSKYVCVKCIRDLKIVNDVIKKLENSRSVLEKIINEEKKIPKNDLLCEHNYFDFTKNIESEFTENNFNSKINKGESINFQSNLENVKKSVLKIKEEPFCVQRNLEDLVDEPETLDELKDNQESTTKLAPKKKTPLTSYCGRCNIYFETIELLQQHRRENHSSDRIVNCPICFKHLKAKHIAAHKYWHINKKNGSKHLCEICGKHYGTKSILNTHMKAKHLNFKPHVCGICGKRFINKHKLSEHRRIHSDERSYICELCGATFRLKNCLDRHVKLKRCFNNNMKIKNNGKTFIEYSCNKCYMILPTKRALNKHKGEKHSLTLENIDENIFKCEKCEDYFYTPALLKKHQIIHAEVKYSCVICHFTCLTKERLLQHKLIHEVKEQKNFMCEICNKTFARKLSLQYHLAAHTGQKRYRCEICPKTFVQSSHLSAHKRVHTGSKPYVCPYCNKGFALNGNLTVHIRTHTGERPYKCSYCDQAFYDSGTAKKHISMKHGL